ncbi:hypothetical protein MtrunA17_Chr4g0032161 [Medicago truncatula]|uniref:Uncharacterized protein n=1 Tax=Medicago truncatula TaxID=3880 RepID=A0A396IDX1_MEDTR|nr:hypothetical protein MtrunA17_Chr4g0032161 [Medicago truncatula]
MSFRFIDIFILCHMIHYKLNNINIYMHIFSKKNKKYIYIYFK